MSAIFDLVSNLRAINKQYEVGMKKSVENFERYVQNGYSEIFQLIPFVFPEARKRRAYRVKCHGLILMDREQIALAERCASERHRVRKQVAEQIAERRKPVNNSAWFSGEYDERTYY